MNVCPVGHRSNTLKPQDWVRIDALLSEANAHYLRDLIHQQGFPARIEQAGAGWHVLVRREHVGIAMDIYHRNFDGGNRPRWRRVTDLFRRRRAA
jgi:hypothetical protein